MDTNDFASPEPWAERQWGGPALGDAPRSARAVRLGAALAARHDASLPAQTGTWGDLKAAYRLLTDSDVTHGALSRPHQERTRAEADRAGGGVLFLQDTTGLVLHTCLGVLPARDQPPVLGVAAQKVWARQKTHRGKQTHRGKETRT